MAVVRIPAVKLQRYVERQGVQPTRLVAALQAALAWLTVPPSVSSGGADSSRRARQGRDIRTEALLLRRYER